MATKRLLTASDILELLGELDETMSDGGESTDSEEDVGASAGHGGEGAGLDLFDHSMNVDFEDLEGDSDDGDCEGDAEVDEDQCEGQSADNDDDKSLDGYSSGNNNNNADNGSSSDDNDAPSCSSDDSSNNVVNIATATPIPTPATTTPTPVSTTTTPTGKYQLAPATGDWKKQEPTGCAFLQPSTYIPGPCFSLLPSKRSAKGYFDMIFLDSVWEIIVRETNLYADQSIQDPQHARPWKDVTMEEMKAFIGIVILMGVIRLPRLTLYWQRSHDLMIQPLSQVMSLKRFQQIWRFFHLADNTKALPSTNPNRDKLFKVRPIMKIVQDKVESLYNLHRQVTIDEAMIPFKGRLSIVQYMKAKPVKWGIKVFVLSDAVTAYIYRFQIYTGKNLEARASDAGLCSRSVLDLLDGLSNLELYTDNYYTSPRLYLHLYNKYGINSCGTVRTNRKDYPKALVLKKSVGNKKDRGFMDYRSNGVLLAYVWKDRKIVNFLTTAHVAECDDIVEIGRRNKKGEKVDIPCPPLQPDYQQYMQGVDRGDQLISLYNAGRRSRKWWRRVFFYILEVAIFNAYILEGHSDDRHRKKGTAKRDMLAFRLELAELLIGGFVGRKSAGRPRAVRDDIRLKQELSHLPVYSPTILDCVVCCKKGEKMKQARSQSRHRSHFVCSTCNVHLCIHKDRQCFSNYHLYVD